MYDKVASRLSEQLLAALAWSAQTRTPNTDNNNAVNVTPSSTTASPSRRSWEIFLAQLVSNLSSEAKAMHLTARSTSTTSSQHSTVTATSTPSVATVPGDVARQQQRQRQQLVARKQYHQHRYQHAPRVSLARRTRPESLHTPLNLKSPPAVRLNRLQLSTDKPASRSLKATTRLPLPTTPPAYLRRAHPPVTSAVEHFHHHHHQQQHQQHHQRVINTAPTANLNSTHNNTNMPVNQHSAASLFRTLGLWSGNDVNVTSSSVNMADMMRYVIAQVTRHVSAGTPCPLTY